MAGKTQKKERVGILGGNFNPVHYAHLIVASQVYHQLKLDKIYLMPSFESPHVDPKKTISASHRIEMLKLALVEDSSSMEIETIEIERQGKSYTYDTMAELTSQHPEKDYYFIIGGDMVDYLPKWHRIDDLIKIVQLVGVNRPGYPLTSDYPVKWVEVPMMDISSSYIREKISTGGTVDYLLPKNVIDYIDKKGLYQYG